MLELIRRLVGRRAGTEPLRVAVLGCSTGVEAYSIAWTIRSARPDLKLVMRAADISEKAVEFGRCGRYSLIDPQLTDSNVFERMTEAEMTDLFDRDGGVVTVKPWIREGIEWRAGDVTKPETIDALGPQDIVIASNFLCHMPPAMAEECLRNIARLARPDGYLFASGVDLDVRTKVADDLGWRPVQELLEDIHEGDPVMKTYWPWHYAGVEPLNKKRRDWQLRYAAAFQALPGDENTDRPVDCEASRKVAASKEFAD
jgi:SAM-dependent methyltransferase